MTFFRDSNDKARYDSDRCNGIEHGKNLSIICHWMKVTIAYCRSSHDRKIETIEPTPTLNDMISYGAYQYYKYGTQCLIFKTENDIFHSKLDTSSDKSIKEWMWFTWSRFKFWMSLSSNEVFARRVFYIFDEAPFV